jgi:hypothetical protein
MPRLARSITAVAIGFFLIGALAFGTDYALVASGIYPPVTQFISDPALLGGMALYVAVFAIGGCWLTAYLAPDRPMRHALILGALGLLLNLGMFQLANARTPMWYNLLGLALVMPYAWIGGRLRERQLAGAGGPVRATS